MLWIISYFYWHKRSNIADTHDSWQLGAIHQGTGRDFTIHRGGKLQLCVKSTRAILTLYIWTMGIWLELLSTFFYIENTIPIIYIAYYLAIFVLIQRLLTEKEPMYSVVQLCLRHNNVSTTTLMKSILAQRLIIPVTQMWVLVGQQSQCDSWLHSSNSIPLYFCDWRRLCLQGTI